MLIEVDTRNQAVTENKVTARLMLDENTCFILAQAFRELGDALGRARISFKQATRWKATEDKRKEAQERLRADIEATMSGLVGLPVNQMVSGVAKAHEMSWDQAACHVKEIRRDGRRSAARSRDETVMQLSKNGLPAGAIGEALQLSPGTVRNILSRLKQASVPPALSKARDALKFAAE